MSSPARAPIVGLGRHPAVAAAPRRRGALLTAAVTDPGGGDQWLKGVDIWPEAAPGYRLVTDHGDPLDHGAGTAALPYGGRPILIQTFAACPRGDIGELATRAENQLRAITSQAMARELWTGELTTTAPWTLPGLPHGRANPRSGSGDGNDGPWTNPHLADAEMLPAAPHPAAAVGAVEAAAMARLAGGPVYIHVPPMLLLELSQFGIHPDGDVLTTPLGSVVVADAGYGSAVIDGDVALAVYATGPVQAWWGDDITVLDDPTQIVDLDNNQVGVWAERPALSVFDPQTLVGCTIQETA